MANTSLMKKLLIRPGQRVLILNSPLGYVDELGQLPEGVALRDRPEGTYDFVHLFVKSIDELARLAPTAIEAAKRDGLLWISYPKRSSKVDTDITRDIGWETVHEAGWRPVTQVSIDETWSALRFRPSDEVGQRKTE